MKTSAVYLYGLLESPRRPSAAAAPPGLAGMTPPRLVPLDEGLWIILSAAPASRYSAARIERGLKDLEWVGTRAAAHEAVLEYFRPRGTLIPLKLFTLFADEGRALADLRARRRKLAALLARLRGCSEWGVRVRFDERLAPRPPAALPRGTGKAATGTRFLALKKHSRDAVAALRERARAGREALFEELGAGAREARMLDVPEGPTAGSVVLDAVFLVADDEAARFVRRLKAAARREGPLGFAVTLSGPWPAYNFAS